LKYLITLAASEEASKALRGTPGDMGKEVGELIEQIKPETIYFSTIRRLIFMAVNINDPHVELRVIFEKLARFGKVTIDPVSSLEEFSGFMKQYEKI
jgi:hypothetical protein